MEVVAAFGIRNTTKTIEAPKVTEDVEETTT
jgi:hypothetical protein